MLPTELSWMKATQIGHHYETLKKHKFNGRALTELKTLPLQRNFFKVSKDICISMGIEEIGEILQFCAAIRKL
jgi:hypothetical protein